MATTDAAPKTSEVSVAEAKARLSELLRRVELSGEQIDLALHLRTPVEIEYLVKPVQEQ